MGHNVSCNHVFPSRQTTLHHRVRPLSYAGCFATYRLANLVLGTLWRGVAVSSAVLPGFTASTTGKPTSKQHLKE